MPYRHAAPREEDELEDEHPYAIVLRTDLRRALWRTAAVAVCSCAAAGALLHRPPRPGASQVDAIRVARAMREAHGAMTHARHRAELANAAFERSLRGAIGEGVSPHPELGPCAVRLPEARSLAPGRPSFPLLVLARATFESPLQSRAVARALAGLEREQERLDAGLFEEASVYARDFRPEQLGYEMVLLAPETTPPRALSGREYLPGEAKGRAYLYDFTTGLVVCAADIHAKSSPQIGYTFADRPFAPQSLGDLARMSYAVEEDLRFRIEHEIVAAMRFRAAPPAGRYSGDMHSGL